MLTATSRVVRKTASAAEARQAAWSAGDSARALAWLLVAVAARAPLVARIEGALDHDQSIVGLMALDIAAGRRWPIFFDGQRYMGAVEAYVAAALVALFGHSPTVVAMAPLGFFGLFAAGQYILWRTWSDRTTGHLAALVTVVSSPMLALWSIVPRGGYIEVLVWALAALGVYRRMIRPAGTPQSRWAQAGWGFLLGLGYFLNPLSLIVYLTMALDWTFGRHGAGLREERGLAGGWTDSARAPVAWLSLAALGVLALAVCCHVDFTRGPGATPFVFLLGALPRNVASPLGALGVVAILAAAAWWSGMGARSVRLVARHAWFTLGVIAAMGPFVLNNLLVCWGRLPWNQSLPIWIRAPWDIGVNVQTGTRALGPLIGCSPEAPATLLLGQGVELPQHVWTGLSRALGSVSPLVVAVVAALIAHLAWRDRRAWRRLWSLAGSEPTPPTVLALLGLAVTSVLYLLQATSLNASSIRYLVPAWVVLPGLIASGLAALPARWRLPAVSALLVPWALAQANLWADMGRVSPHRAVARALEEQGTSAIVAQTPVALIVANLTDGRVGALEYRPEWPRLRDRYAGRFRTGEPVICVVDRDFPWEAEGGFGWPPSQDLGRSLRALAASHPGRVRLARQVGHFEIWRAELPLVEVLGERERNDIVPLHPGAESAKVAGNRMPRP